MSAVPQSSRKPTAYLDQNILDLIIKYGLDEFCCQLMREYQVVYSDETLKEIKRSVGAENKFLTVLKSLGAHYLKIVVEQPGFVITDKATIAALDPFDAYEEYCLNTADDYLEHAVQQWLFKFSGGRSGDSISDIHSEQITAFNTLIDSIKVEAEELPPYLKKEVVEYANEMKSRYRATVEEFEVLIKRDVSDDRNWNGIKDFRNHLNIGPKELNNIQPPNIIFKIWEKYKQLPPYSFGADIEQFLGIKTNSVHLGRPFYLHEKVGIIYQMLNTIGYYPDSKVHKERRFVAAMSDNSHAAMASFCSVLISRDENFIKKTSAVYEYLNIGTLIEQIVVNFE